MRILWFSSIRNVGALISLLTVLTLYDVRVTAIGSAAEQGALPPPPNFVSAMADGARVSLAFSPSSFNPPTTSFLIEVGSASGLSDLGVLSTNGYQTFVGANAVPAGAYHVRIRGVNTAGVGPASNERVVVVPGCTMPPAPPTPPSAVLGGVLRVHLSWNADQSPCPATSYLLEAGSARGLSDLGVVPITGTSVTFQPVPVGTYYVRLRGRNAQGVSPPSTPDLQLFVESPCLPPMAPINVQAPRLGNAVTFSWQFEAPGDIPPSRLFPASVAIEAGSTPGAANLGVFPVDPHASPTFWGPPGTYWTRVRSTNACGSSVVSSDVMVTLTAECVVPGRIEWADIVGSTTFATPRFSQPIGGGVATSYVVDVGRTPGPTDIRSYTIVVEGPGGMTGLAPGTYVGRVRGQNICGAGLPSPIVSFVVGASCQIPDAPSLVQATRNGQAVTLIWWTGAIPGISLGIGSRVEVGTTAGASDVLVTDLSPSVREFAEFVTTLPSGHYFARVKLMTACGISNPSREVEFTVP